VTRIIRPYAIDVARVTPCRPQPAITATATQPKLGALPAPSR
jgi:hypothetical protein